MEKLPIDDPALKDAVFVDFLKCENDDLDNVDLYSLLRDLI